MIGKIMVKFNHNKVVMEKLMIIKLIMAKPTNFFKKIMEK
jgi:hypothetical protein